MLAANIVNTITINIEKLIEAKHEYGEIKPKNGEHGEILPIPPPTHPNTRMK